MPKRKMRKNMLWELMNKTCKQLRWKWWRLLIPYLEEASRKITKGIIWLEKKDNKVIGSLGNNHPPPQKGFSGLCFEEKQVQALRQHTILIKVYFKLKHHDKTSLKLFTTPYKNYSVIREQRYTNKGILWQEKPLKMCRCFY